MSKTALIVVNFGGPRNLLEIPSFLRSLLTDEDVIRTHLPRFLEKKLFERIARKRAPVIAHDYEKIGGGSPIYEDTNWFFAELSQQLDLPGRAFHRYLDATHPSFIEEIEKMEGFEFLVFPLFPQFCYATTGSIARWFSRYLKKDIVSSMHWIRSYGAHKAYLTSFTACLQEFLQEKGILESEAFLLFSAHGVPVQFICQGDLYKQECEASFFLLSQRFPKATCFLSYQSKFGRGKWLEPSTQKICQSPKDFIGDKKHVVLIPLTFTSDHIETLFEIEGYASLVRSQGIQAHRCPALGRRTDWVLAAKTILQEGCFVSNQELIRRR